MVKMLNLKNAAIVLGVLIIVLFTCGSPKPAHAEENLGDYANLPEINLTDRQKFCMIQNIYFEARNQDVEGQKAILFVTLNRVISDKYPNTICKVVWQRGQFSWTHDGKSDRMKNHESWKEISNLVDKYLGYYDTIHDETKGSLFYHAHYARVCSWWTKKLTKTVTIGQHIFYKPKEA